MGNANLGGNTDALLSNIAYLNLHIPNHFHFPKSRLFAVPLATRFCIRLAHNFSFIIMPHQFIHHILH